MNNLETSPEIILAINAIAPNNAIAEQIWEDPSEADLIAIWAAVTNNGAIDASTFCWGAAGSDWANSILAV